MTKEFVDAVALVAAVVLPLWNIPLVLKIIKRKSSADISLWWAFGVWVCLLLMFPSGLMSKDVVWRVFNIINIVFFTSVVTTTLIYRPKNH